MASRLGVYTSIPPSFSRQDREGRQVGAGYLASCVKSWATHGWTVHSIHSTTDERALITNPIEGVDYAFVDRSTSQPKASRAPTISGILAQMLAAEEEDAFILLNADVVLLPGEELAARLSVELAGSLVIAPRLDVTEPWASAGTYFPFGYDFFALDRDLLSRLPPASFVTRGLICHLGRLSCRLLGETAPSATP